MVVRKYCTVDCCGISERCSSLVFSEKQRKGKCLLRNKFGNEMYPLSAFVF